MPTVLNATATEYGGGALSFTPTAGVQYVFALQAYNGTSTDGTSTFNGVAMTELHSFVSTDPARCLKLWGIATTASGAQTYAASGTSTPRGTLIWSCSDVNTGAPLLATPTNFQVGVATTAFSQAVGSASGHLAIACVYVAGGGVGSLTPTAPTTLIDDFQGDFHFVAALAEAGAASSTLVGTFGTAVGSVGFLFSVQPASASVDDTITLVGGQVTLGAGTFAYSESDTILLEGDVVILDAGAIGHAISQTHALTGGQVTLGAGTPTVSESESVSDTITLVGAQVTLAAGTVQSGISQFHLLTGGQVTLGAGSVVQATHQTHLLVGGGVTLGAGSSTVAEFSGLLPPSALALSVTVRPALSLTARSYARGVPS